MACILVVESNMTGVVDSIDGGHEILGPADKAGIRRLIDEHGDRIDAVATSGSLKVDQALLDRLKNLQLVAHFGVGYDTTDVQACIRRDVAVTHTPGVLSAEVADSCIGLLLMTVRRLSAAERYLREGRWQNEGSFPLCPTTLRERSVGILGLGRIGREVARRVEGFGLPIAYHTRRQVADVPYRYYADAREMAAAVDTVLCILPLTQATHRLVDAAFLDALGPDGVLVNVGRGAVVDEQTLADYLQSGRIAAAGLDVFEHEPRVNETLLKCDNAVLLPHIASASLHTRLAMGRLVSENLNGWFARRQLATPVQEMRAANAAP